jgi:MinD-like ATPase involved in chromosome partitioning or flagellar assembly
MSSESTESKVEMGRVLRLARQSTALPAQARPAPRRAAAAVSPSEILDRLGTLERSALFFTLEASTLRLLARRARSVVVAPGTVVVAQGETGDTMFLIEGGHCLIRRDSSPGHSVVVAVLGPGDIFGEDAFVFGEGSRVSAVASDEVRLLAIDRSTLHAALPADVPFLHDLARFAEHRRATFADMSVQAEWDLLTGGATVISVYSPKGGTGRTTIALNLVARLASQRPREVVLVDLAFPYPHAALMANLVPNSCLARLRETPPDLFEDSLLSSVLYHPSGLMVLPGALQPEEADLVTGELVGRAIEALRRTFRYVVVDLGVAMTDVTLAALDQSQHVLLVVTPEITAVKSAADASAILSLLGILTERVSLVLNHRTAVAALSRNAVERGVGRAVTHEIPFDGARPAKAAIHGSILAVDNPKSELTRAVESIATRIEARHAAESEPNSAPALGSRATP